MMGWLLGPTSLGHRDYCLWKAPNILSPTKERDFPPSIFHQKHLSIAILSTTLAPMEAIPADFADFLITKAHRLAHEDPSAPPELRQFFKLKDDVEELVTDSKFEAPAKILDMVQSDTPPTLNDWHNGFSDNWNADKNVWVVYAVILVKTSKCAPLSENDGKF
jgi:hypothetical protein